MFIPRKVHVSVVFIKEQYFYKVTGIITVFQETDATRKKRAYAEVVDDERSLVNSIR